MQNFWTVFSFLFRYMFKRDKTRGSAWRLLILIVPGIAGLGLLVGFVFLTYSIVPILNDAGLVSEFLLYVLFMSMFVVFILGLVPTITHLYLSRDIEFFASMPLGKSTVYFSKLAISYLIQLIFMAGFSLPFVVTTGVVLGFGVVYYVCMAVALLSLPIVPLLVISILAIPTMYVVKFFKNRQAMTTIALLALFAAGYILYFTLIVPKGNNNNGNSADPGDVIAGFINSTANMKYALLPIVGMINIALGKNVWINSMFESTSTASLYNIGTFLGFFIIIYIILRLISGKIYMSGAIAQLEGRANLHIMKSKDVVSSQFKALVSKEFKELIRTPAFSMNTLITLVMAPIFSFIFARGVGGSADTFGTLFDKEYVYIAIIMFTVMLSAGINIGAATSVSREGEKFYIMKIMPVDFSVQIKAKLRVYRIISASSIVLSFIIFGAVSGEYTMAILAAGFAFLYAMAMINFVAMFDLNRPKLKWNSPSEVVKRNANVQIPTYVSMGIIVVLVALGEGGFALFKGVVGLNNTWSMFAVWCIFYAISGTLMIIFGVILKNMTHRCIERIEV